MTTAPRHGYETKPWLALLDDVQKAPVAPPPTVVHAFRAGAARHPGRAPRPRSRAGIAAVGSMLVDAVPACVTAEYTSDRLMC